MTIITRDQIDALPAHTIADVLRLASSVDVRARGVHGRPDRLRHPRRQLRPDARARGRRAAERRAVGAPQRRHSGAARGGGAHRDPAGPGLGALRRRRLRRHRQRDHAAHARRPRSRCAAAPTTTRRAAASGRFERGGTSQLLERLGGSLVGLHVRPRLQERHRALAHVVRPLDGVAVVPVEGVRRQQLLRRQRAVARVDQPDAGRRPNTRLGTAGGWSWRLGESYRTHGDHFIFNQTNPALSNNQHRSHAVLATFAGLAAGGRRHRHGRRRGRRRLDSLDQSRQPLDLARQRRSASGGGRLRRRRRSTPRCASTATTSSAPSWSPSLGAGWWPAPRLRLRASVGPRVSRAHVHRALLLGSGQPGARRGRPRARLGRRGRRRYLRRAATGRCTRPCSAAPTAT